MNEQPTHPDPEKLWDRRWKSHVATIAMIPAYLYAVKQGAPTEPVWALVLLAMGHVAPAVAQELAKLRRP